MQILLIIVITILILFEKMKYDRGQIFVKAIAGFLAILMVVGTVASLIYALF